MVCFELLKVTSRKLQVGLRHLTKRSAAISCSNPSDWIERNSFFWGSDADREISDSGWWFNPYIVLNASSPMGCRVVKIQIRPNISEVIDSRRITASMRPICFRTKTWLTSLEKGFALVWVMWYQSTSTQRILPQSKEFTTTTTTHQVSGLSNEMFYYDGPRCVSSAELNELVNDTTTMPGKLSPIIFSGSSLPTPSLLGWRWKICVAAIVFVSRDELVSSVFDTSSFTSRICLWYKRLELSGKLDFNFQSSPRNLELGFVPPNLITAKCNHGSLQSAPPPTRFIECLCLRNNTLGHLRYV